MTAERSLRPVESAPITTPDLFSDDRIRLIKQQVANGAPDNLFAAMIEIARTRGLDPLAKQISLINFGGTWQITTTIDGYRALAEQTGAYAGSDAAVFTETEQGGILSATVTVWKMVDHQRVPFSATVYWAEYNANNFTWKKMPRTMLAKVAESHALRKAFPAVLSGVYTADEMAQAGPVITGEVIDHDTGEITQPAPQRSITDTVTMAPPRTTARPLDADVDGSPDPNRLKASFALGTSKGLARDEIKTLAYHRYGVTSMTHLTMEQVRDFYSFLNKNGDDGLRFELSQARAAMADDAEYTEVSE